ncbi:MAG: acyl-CoA/acyl-ACP dehydrogenase [Betaproteobacteria bacterium]|nr:acyl-CoA/acyl-ACP dehydrogenase [Betaproteobacteria bacterium]
MMSGNAASVDEHRALLAESVADFTARGTTIARVRKLRGTPQEYDRAVWKQMATLGWLGILVPEPYGGLGLGLTEMAIVARGLARALVPEPLTATAVLAASALAAGENEALKRRELPRLAAGETLPALAWQEAAGVLDPAAITTRAEPIEGGYKLNGLKRFIAGSAQADAFLVSARAGAGIVLLWLPRDTAGARLALEPLADGRAFGALALEDALIPADGVAASGAVAAEALARAFDHGAAIAGAELAGVMDRALEMSLDYLKTRVQFGKPIGAFQALQHRAVDLYIQKELAGAALGEALAVLDRHPGAGTRAALASRVKARCTDAALRITREAIQLHGAIGFTDEYDVGLYLKRALTLAAWLGQPTWHRRRYASLTAREMADGGWRMADGVRSGGVP